MRCIDKREDAQSLDLEVQTQVYVPHFHIAIPQHGAELATDGDAIYPMLDVVRQGVNTVHELAHRTEPQAVPVVHACSIGIDLLPKDVEWRDVIAERDVATIAYQVQVKGSGKEIIDQGQDKGRL